MPLLRAAWVSMNSCGDQGLACFLMAGFFLLGVLLGGARRRQRGDYDGP